MLIFQYDNTQEEIKTKGLKSNFCFFFIVSSQMKKVHIKEFKLGFKFIFMIMTVILEAQRFGSYLIL